MNLAAVQDHFRLWLVNADEDAAAALGSGPAFASGLAVYQNNYRVSLMGCLAEHYQRVAAWLGDTAFAAACASHIDAVCPSSWTLDDYGETFCDTLAALYPADPEVADLARLDRALGQAFIGPDSAMMAVTDLGDVDWETAVIGPVPTLAVLHLTTNADAIWLAMRSDDAPPAPQMITGGVDLLVWRQGLEPVFRRADAEEAEMLDWSRQGQGFAAICALLAERSDPQAAATVAGTVLGRWLGEGMVAAVA